MTAREIKRRIPRKAAIGIGLVGLLMAVASTLAVHDEAFQLDRNTAVDSPPLGGASFATAVNDWENLFTSDPSMPLTGEGNRPTRRATLPTGFSDANFVEDWAMVNGSYQTDDPTTFTQSKDIDNISSWRCKTANQVTNKGDITNSYAAVYEVGNKKILYFGLEKDQDSGDNNVGLWLIQNPIDCQGGGTGNGNAFTGSHTPGDIFLVSEFTNGGGVGTIKAYKWVADINPKPNITTPGVDPNPFAIGADCVDTPAADDPTPGTSFSPGQLADRLCATSNVTQFSPGWTHWSFDNGLNSGLRPATFIEGGITLSDFTEFQNTCFSRFLFNTRSSQELTATLFDYSLGSINTCNASVSITPSGTNEVGQPHTFTITATSSGGAVPTIAITPTVSPSVTPPASNFVSTCGTPTLTNGGKTATCTVTINSQTAGTFTANATATFSFGGGFSLTRDTDPATTTIDPGPGGSGPATKVYVDANISITGNGTNEVGQAHTFTVEVNQNLGAGAGFVDAAVGNVDVVLTSSSGAAAVIDTAASTCDDAQPSSDNLSATGTCIVVFTSNSAGQVRGDATVTIPTSVTGTAAAVVRDTITGGGNTIPVGSGGSETDPLKTFVDANISITGNGTNEVGQAHTFTVEVNQNLGAGGGWVAADLGNVDVTLSNSNGAAYVIDAAASTCDDAQPSGDNLSATGTCIVVFTSATAGQVKGDATVTIPTSVTGTTAAIVRDTNSGTASIGAGTGGSETDPLKTFVDANISITGNGTNGVGDPHTFTVEVNQNLGAGGGWVDAAVGNVDVTLTNSLGAAYVIDATASTCDDAQPSGDNLSATGTCIVVFTSATAGTVKGDAAVSIPTTVTGLASALVRDTNSGTASIGAGTGGSETDAVKNFIAGSLTWIKHDGAGALLGGATFEVCRTHDRFGTDITDVCVTVTDENDGDALTTSPDADLDLGEFKLEGLVLGRYRITETVPPVGYHGDPTPQTVELTLASPDGSAANPFVNLRAFRLIVIGCDDITDTLEETTVWLDLDDDNIVDPGETLLSITDVPAHLAAKGVTEADLCGTDGVEAGTDIPAGGLGGASYGGLAPATYRSLMQIPN